MRKNIIIAVASLAISTMALAQSSVTLYGTIEQTLETTTRDTVGKKNTNMDSGDSKIGVKVNEDLGNGLNAFGVIEFDVKAEGNSPWSNDGQTYLGLASSDYGTIKMGQFKTFTGLSARKTIRKFEGRNFTVQRDLNTDNSFAYVTPVYHGFTGGISIITNGYSGLSADKAHIDGNEYALNYSNGGLYTSLTHMRLRTADGSAQAKNTFLGASYSLDKYEVNGAYERASTGLASRNIWTLGGAYSLTPSNTLRVAYTSDTSNHTGYTLEAVHNFSKRTAVYTNYQSINGRNTNASTNTLGLGLRHHF